jgi:hypothetical protein
VKISPSFQTKYLHEDNVAEFYILDGSNTFNVKTNTSEVANLQHLVDKNVIEMVPKYTGIVEIRVEDLGVEQLQTAEAVLLVSDVIRLELTGGGLIEEGNSVNLTVKAFDIRGKQFDEDQMKSMRFITEVEKIGTGHQDAGIEITQMTDSLFDAKGVASGNYRVTVSIDKRTNLGERTSSNYVRIEVFNQVQIVPTSLLLFPGGRWTIQVEGGPHGGARGSVYRKYKIENEMICEIDENGEVLGKNVGETYLHLNMHYKNEQQTNLLASRKIPVRVALITSIEVPVMNERSIFVNSLTRLNVRLRHNKEVFLHAIGPLSFNWQALSKHIYSLSLPSRKDSKGGSSTSNLVLNKANIYNSADKGYTEFTTNFNYSSIVGVANKKGDAKIKVTMAIEYPEKYKNEKNFFTHTIEVKVTDKLTMNVPEFIEYPTKEPHIYILPPSAKNKIVTNKDAKVRLAYSMTPDSE